MSSNDRLAIVTGTSSGLGAAIALALLARDWTVVGMSRRRPDISSPGYRHIEIDLGDLPRLREIAENELAPIVAEPTWSRIGLVNNAGAIGSMRALEQADPLQVASVFAVNAIAPIFLTGFVVRTAPPPMPLRIVNVSTGAAVQAIPGIGDYGSSKAALRLASMTFAAELASSERPGGARPEHSDPQLRARCRRHGDAGIGARRSPVEPVVRRLPRARQACSGRCASARGGGVPFR